MDKIFYRKTNRMKYGPFGNYYFIFKIREKVLDEIKNILSNI